MSFTKSTGSTALEDSHDNLGAVYLRMVLDQYNNWNFPSSGYVAVFDLSSTRPGLGADVEYYSGTARFEKAFGTDNNHYRIGFDYYTTFKGERPIYNAFALGGFQNLSGYSQREFLVDGALLGRMVYERRLFSLPAFGKGIYWGGSLEAAEPGESSQRPPAKRRDLFGLDVSGGRYTAGALLLCGGACRSGKYGGLPVPGTPALSRLIERAGRDAYTADRITGRLNPKPGTRRNNRKAAYGRTGPETHCPRRPARRIRVHQAVRESRLGAREAAVAHARRCGRCRPGNLHRPLAQCRSVRSRSRLGEGVHYDDCTAKIDRQAASLRTGTGSGVH